MGFRPNPGLSSTPYYLVEALFLLILFSRGLLRHPLAGLIGVALGWLFFFSVLPTLRLLRNIPALSREK